mmetsp:Transcript_4630/g.6107  ORF Transcript_4630/g.6107 Transcript_4630/m.6107 type:complete len:344 (+) Transcript_4630:29-1060(+)
MFKTFIPALFAAAVAAKDGKDFKGDGYISMSRQDKSDKIWAKVTENSKSGSWHFAQTLFVGQGEVFDTKGDEFDCGLTGCRNKTIHSVGNVGQIEWVDQGGHSYTGIFKGSDSGYVRMSSAKPVDTKKHSMTPGMGVKFLRDGVDSANFVAMFSVDGQDSLNFFENDWNNHIPDPHDATLIPLELRFKTATDYIQTVGLSDMAMYTQDGTEESPVFPWSLRFEPSGDWEFPATTYDPSFMQSLQPTPAGSLLFNVYATDQPTELGGSEQLIAQMKTKSTMVTSNWGDEHMFFRHQRMDDDLKYRPEWEPYTPNPKVFFANKKHDDRLVKFADYAACPFLRFFN